MAGWALGLYLIVRNAFESFRYGRFDLGNMVQAVWSTANGSPLDVTIGTGEQSSRLGSHVDPILALFAPLWLVAPSPLTLAAVQIVACALGALPVFWLGRKYLLSDVSAGLIALAYLSYPWLAWAAAEAMHPITLAIPLLLFAIWFLANDRLTAFVVVAVFACLCGELVGATVGLLGVWYALTRNRRAGAAIAISSVAWTLFCIYVVIPAASGGPSTFYDLYAEVGSSPQGVLRTLFTDPSSLLDALLSPRDLKYFFLLILPTAGWCLLSPGLLAVGLPQLLANALSAQSGATDARLHYVSILVPIIIAATVLGIARLHEQVRTPAVVLSLACSVGLSVLIGPWSGIKHNPWTLGEPPDAHFIALREALSLVPDAVAVSTTNRVGSHVSDRRRVHTVPDILDATWVVIDLQDTWVAKPRDVDQRVWGGRDRRVLVAVTQDLGSNPNWETVLERGDVYVFRRVGSAATG